MALSYLHTSGDAKRPKRMMNEDWPNYKFKIFLWMMNSNVSFSYALCLPHGTHFALLLAIVHQMGN